MSKSAIVIGAGIVGLAAARALALQRFQVTVIERSEIAVGASIRNFGMVWPIGQPDGLLYNRAMRSRQIWKEIADSIGIWYHEAGSLHVANYTDEWEVLQELHASFSQNNRPVKLMDPDAISKEFKGVKSNNLLGGLYSSTELIVDPREAIASIPSYLHEYMDVKFIWGKQVNAVQQGAVWIGDEKMEADIICICSGADFETLYPEHFAKTDMWKCKLQMMRYASTENNNGIGTSVCGGLSLIHYQAFKAAASLEKLKKRYDSEMAEYLKWGIHVMVSQNQVGELTVGDSHEYGHTFDPFDKSFINKMIMDYMATFMQTDDWKLVQSWNGIYPKLKNGEAGMLLKPSEDVYIINGLGGAGMTLSFGYAEELLSNI